MRIAAATEQTAREAQQVADLAGALTAAVEEVEQRHHDARHADGRCTPACHEAGWCNHEDTADERRELEAVEALADAPADAAYDATEEHHDAWSNWLLMAKQLAYGGSVDWQRQRSLLAAEAPPNLCRAHRRIHERTTEADERCILQQMDAAKVRRDGVWDASDFDPREQAAIDARMVAEVEAAGARATAEAADPDGVAEAHAAARAELEAIVGVPIGPLTRTPGDRATYSIALGDRVQDLGERGVQSFAVFKAAVSGATDVTLPEAVRRSWTSKWEPALQKTVIDVAVGDEAFASTRFPQWVGRYLDSQGGLDDSEGDARTNSIRAGRPRQEDGRAYIALDDFARWVHVVGERMDTRELGRGLANAGWEPFDLRYKLPNGRAASRQYWREKQVQEATS